MDSTGLRTAIRSLLLAVIVSLWPPVAAWAQVQKDVLVLYATRADARISVLGDRELPQILEKGLGQRVNYYSEHLDLARFAEVRYQSAVTEFLRLKYAGEKFDLVIAMHEIVLDYLATARTKLFPDTPVVFFSNTTSIGRLPNSTGVITNTDLAATLSLASALQPTVRHVYLVSGAAPRDKVFESRARSQLAAFEPRLQLTYLSGLPTATLKARVAALPPDSIVYYLLLNRDGAGKIFHPIDYLDDLTRVASVPVYSWVESALGRGVLGGSLKSQEKQTAVVAEQALRVLRGERADSVPLVYPDLQVSQVDWRQMRHWGIDESRLPPGTIVLFEDQGIWESLQAVHPGGAGPRPRADGIDRWLAAPAGQAPSG